MEIAPGVHQIEGSRASNAFLLLGNRLTLVDTGLKGNLGAIDRYLRRLGRSLADLELVVLTHCHTDHVGSLPALLKVRQLPVAAHEAEIPYLEGKAHLPQVRGGGLLGAVMKLIQPFFRVGPLKVDLPLREGSELNLLGGARVIHTPGHTPGSLCLYLPDLRLLLVGDVLTHRGGKLGLPDAAFTQDMGETRRSITKLTSLEVETLGFGHGRALVGHAGEALRTLSVS